MGIQLMYQLLVLLPQSQDPSTQQRLTEVRLRVYRMLYNWMSHVKPTQKKHHIPWLTEHMQLSAALSGKRTEKQFMAAEAKSFFQVPLLNFAP